MPKAVMTDWLAPSEVPWPEDDGPWVVRLHWDLTDSSIECVGVELRALDAGPRPRIDAAVVRRLPLGRLIRIAKAARYEESGGGLVEAFDAAEAGHVDDPELLEEASGIVDQARSASTAWQGRRPPGRPRQLDDEHFQEVARVYSRAVGRAAPPRQAVVQRWHTTGATASRWIAQARELGFLPRTEPGVARGSLDLAGPEQEGRR